MALWKNGLAVRKNLSRSKTLDGVVSIYKEMKQPVTVF